MEKHLISLWYPRSIWDNGKGMEGEMDWKEMKERIFKRM
jgi:hypothetical protein